VSPYRKNPLAVSGLPEGDPAGRGVSLDPDIPGTSTFAKPSDEGPREQSKDDESIYRVDDADDLAKSQTKPDSIDHSHARPTQRRPGPHYGPSKTKYPYRDGIPNAHNASILFVANSALAQEARELTIPVGESIVAKRIVDIETGLNPKVLTRAEKCTATLKRSMVSNLRWVFSVDCGNGPKVVRVKASRKGKTTKLIKMEVLFACSCEAWRWLGSEHHSQREEYLDKDPRGTASVPVIKDPLGVNRVCKHVAAVIGVIRAWEIPSK
jgi:hypothetical protein